MCKLQTACKELSQLIENIGDSCYRLHPADRLAEHMFAQSLALLKRRVPLREPCDRECVLQAFFSWAVMFPAPLLYPCANCIRPDIMQAGVQRSRIQLHMLRRCRMPTQGSGGAGNVSWPCSLLKPRVHQPSNDVTRGAWRCSRVASRCILLLFSSRELAVGRESYQGPAELM